MKLGGLGRQVVAVSEAAFGALTFAGAEVALASRWHERRMRRDERAQGAISIASCTKSPSTPLACTCST